MDAVGNHANELLIIFSIIGVTGIIGSWIAKKMKIPDVVIFLIFGMLIGPTLLNVINIDSSPTANELILTFGSAFILYEGGREIKLKVLKKIKVTVTLLSTLGVLISTVIIGYTVQQIFHIPFEYGLLLGAIIASTDPASLIPIFKLVPIQNKIKQTVISESAFNDAAGAVLFTSILGVTFGGQLNLLNISFELILMIFVGAVVGFIIAFLANAMICEKRFGIFKEYAPLVLVISVVFSYEIANSLHGSGYMATFVAGLISGNKRLFGFQIQQNQYEATEHFNESLTSFCKMAIFIVLGTHVDLGAIAQYGIKSLVVVLVFIFISRPLVVLACALPDRKAKWKWNELLFMMWVRETGVIPAALLGIVVAKQGNYLDIYSSTVFLAILITLMLQGTTTSLLAKKLNIVIDVHENKKEASN